MKRKLMTVTIIASMIAASLTGCGSTGSDSFYHNDNGKLLQRQRLALLILLQKRQQMT